MVLRMLADRHQDLTRLRTQAVCRLHALLAALTPGGVQKRLSANAAAAFLRRVQPVTAVEAERKNLALELVADVRRLDRAAKAVKARAKVAVAASGTGLTNIYGVGPIVAALIIGHAGDITRFPSAGHFASYNGTAPIEASSGPKVRHRLNPRGNRQLNHAVHMIAISQSIHQTPGRDYYRRKLAEGKSVKEARRAQATDQRRRLSAAAQRPPRINRSGRTIRGVSFPAPPAFHPDSRLFGSVTPGPTRNLRLGKRHAKGSDPAAHNQLATAP